MRDLELLLRIIYILISRGIVLGVNFEYKVNMKTFLKILVIIIITAIILISIWMIISSSRNTHITAVFDEAAPFPPNMQVFYKGFRIGKVVKVEPNEDYTATLVRIDLFPDDIRIPENVSVRIKTYKDDFDYVDIVSPELASTEFLKNGSQIKGKTTLNIDEFFNKHIEEGNFDILIQGLADMMEGINETVKQTGGLVGEVRETVRAMRPNLVTASGNFSTMSGNFSNASLKINNSVNQQTLDQTMNNLERSSQNLQGITRNIDCATRNLTQTMNNVQCITENVSEIASGVNNTLQKPMGGARLIFGKPVQGCKK